MRVEKNTYRLLEMLAARKIRATFFILGWVAQRCAGLGRRNIQVPDMKSAVMDTRTK